ncbi:hypothetical protein [Rhodococcus koreensis]
MSEPLRSWDMRWIPEPTSPVKATTRSPARAIDVSRNSSSIGSSRSRRAGPRTGVGTVVIVDPSVVIRGTC